VIVACSVPTATLFAHPNSKRAAAAATEQQASSENYMETQKPNRDLFRGGASILIWGVPAAILAVTANLGGLYPVVAWPLALSFMGAACLFNARRCERRRKLRFPHPLRKPRSLRTLSEMLLYIIREPGDLFQAILGRDYGKDWLVKTASNDFYLATLYQRSKLLKIFRMRTFQPFEQDT